MRLVYLIFYNIFLAFVHLCIYFMININDNSIEIELNFLRSGYTYTYLLCIIIPFSTILGFITLLVQKRFIISEKLILFVDSLIIILIQSTMIYLLFRENLTFIIIYSVLLVISFFILFKKLIYEVFF